jgi:hypothetical protein
VRCAADDVETWQQLIAGLPIPYKTMAAACSTLSLYHDPATTHHTANGTDSRATGHQHV